MTRYFYTDALAAAWQAKHHGMSFLGTTRQPIQGQYILHPIVYENGEWVRITYSNTAIRLKSEKLFVAPESLQLLEPQEGDVITSGLPFFHFLTGNSGIGGTPIGSLLQAIGPQGMKSLRIILRNAIPFMWPESETA